MEIRLLEYANEDLREGWKFYEKNSTGLGDYFLDCIQADVHSLRIYSGIHEMAEGFHRMLVKRFPFALYYLVEDKPLIFTQSWIADAIPNGLSNAWRHREQSDERER